jgi:hypothetical protein
MPFMPLTTEEAFNIENDHLFDEVDLDDADVVVDCQVEIDFDEMQSCDAIVAAFASRDGNEPIGEPIDDLSFFLSNAIDPNEISFQVSGVARFSVLVRRTGVPGSLGKATFRFQRGSINNRF